ncbi:hypothetical protein [Ralstonia pseudosolanacearum]|uniref:hypothetical protein n=1 Tax=Ralstonia pseudosolanacearum TaxID=1310165 RepID=UPI003CF617CE
MNQQDDQKKLEARLFAGTYEYWCGPWRGTERHCHVVVDVANDKLVAAQIANGDEMNESEKEGLTELLFKQDMVSQSPEEWGLSPIESLPHWALDAESQEKRKQSQYQDDEVTGLNMDGCVMQWDGDKGLAFNSGESLEEFGLHNLREHELGRVGVTREAWTNAVAEQAGKQSAAKSLTLKPSGRFITDDQGRKVAEMFQPGDSPAEQEAIKSRIVGSFNALPGLVGVLLRADKDGGLWQALYNEGITDAYDGALSDAVKALGEDGIAMVAHRYELDPESIRAKAEGMEHGN